MKGRTVKKMCFLQCLLVTYFVFGSVAFAADRVVVVPLGGSVGDATATDVLKDKTFSNDQEKGVAGTMPNNGAYNITPGATAKSIPEGYHDGMGQVETDADLVDNKIKKGITIFGVTGSYPDTAKLDDWNGACYDSCTTHFGPLYSANWYTCYLNVCDDYRQEIISNP